MSIQISSQGAIEDPPLADTDVADSPVKLSDRRAAREDPTDSKEKDTKTQPKQILVIDDDKEVRFLVARTVMKAGFRADTARDGEEGWKALCITDYDLVITDHEMPKLTGLKLIERMRKVSIEPPCIFISANMPLPESDLEKIVHRGAVLPKPFSPTQLIERVYELLLLGDLQG